MQSIESMSFDLERDLGVQAHNSLKVATQAGKVAKAADDMIAQIYGQGIQYKSQKVMLQLHKTLVMPHLE